MKNLPALNLYLFKLAMLLSLVCLSLKNGLSIDLSTDSLGILLLITWGVMGISVCLNIMTYISEHDTKYLYMVLVVLSINTLFFAQELDSGMKKGATFLIIALAIWLSIVELLVIKKR